jgi:hypothetical protein
VRATAFIALAVPNWPVITCTIVACAGRAGSAGAVVTTEAFTREASRSVRACSIRVAVVRIIRALVDVNARSAVARGAVIVVTSVACTPEASRGVCACSIRMAVVQCCILALMDIHTVSGLSRATARVAGFASAHERVHNWCRAPCVRATGGVCALVDVGTLAGPGG